MTGPLRGLRVVELAALGPVPHACMVLADLGADLVHVARPGTNPMSEIAGSVDNVLRGRTSVVADLKTESGRADVLELIDAADVLAEGFRPGVMERLGLGPDACLERNPRLVYARMTGWGREGSLAQTAGHDLNYLAVTGVLNMIGPADAPPPPPLTLVGDYGGGSMFLVSGVLAALVERGSSGQGQVVDVAMIDGVAVLAQKMWAMRAAGTWSEERGVNLLDGAAPFYRTYSCSDGRYLAVAAIERPFFAQLLEGLGIAAGDVPGDQYDRTCWPALRDLLASRIRTRPRDDWAARFAGTDACVAPVLTMSEAIQHPHAVARSAFVDLSGAVQPAPAPRFARTPTATPVPPPSGPPTPVAVVLDRWRRQATPSG
jgi:alpha-methylacyl-CoA racemase